MRPLEGRRVAHASGIEDGDVSFHSRSQQSAIEQAEALGGKRRHLSHRVLERDRVSLANVHGQDSSKRAVASWMRVSLSEDRNLAVRADHCRGMLEDPFEIRLVDRVKDSAAAAAFDDPQAGFGGVFNRRLHSTQASYVSQVLPGRRRIPSAARDYDILRISAAALVFDDPDSLCFDLRARSRVLEPLHDFRAASFLGPGGKQRRLNTRARSGVRILIDSRVDSTSARLVDQSQRVDALSPVGRADDLMVSHLSGKPTAFTDRYGLFDAVDYARRLVTHVRDVDSSETAGDSRQLDDLVCWGERTGHVKQPGAEPERAVLHALLDQRTHLLQLFGVRPAIGVADHRRAHRALADETADVDGLCQSFEPVEKWFERNR